MKIYSTDPDLQRAFLLGYAWAVGVMYGRRNRVAQDDQKWRTTDNGEHYQVDTDTKRVIKGNIGFSNVGGQKASESVTANIQRGKEAVRKALQDKTSVHRAMYREGLGWVDFEWGDIGRVKPSGKTKGGKGISQIIEARIRKDRLTREQVLECLDRTVAKGRKMSHYKEENSENITIIDKKDVVILVRNKGSNAWVLTGFVEK